MCQRILTIYYIIRVHHCTKMISIIFYKLKVSEHSKEGSKEPKGSDSSSTSVIDIGGGGG